MFERIRNVHLFVILAETENVDKNVALERLAIVPDETSGPHDRFGVVPVDVNDRNANGFGHVAAVARRAGTFGWCCISNLYIYIQRLKKNPIRKCEFF